ncbi:Uncharacterised protein [Mycobacteroides abscessus]|nr:Uncharacterised protein [Mycobacteroides abscessus]
MPSAGAAPAGAGTRSRPNASSVTRRHQRAAGRRAGSATTDVPSATTVVPAPGSSVTGAGRIPAGSAVDEVGTFWKDTERAYRARAVRSYPAVDGRTALPQTCVDRGEDHASRLQPDV